MFKVLGAGVLAAILYATLVASAQQPAAPPSMPLRFAGFAAHFASDGTFTLEGAGRPAFKGTWKADGGEIEIATTGGPPACLKPDTASAQKTRARRSVSYLTNASRDG